VSHIYREGNVCANGLVNFGLSLTSLDDFWFDDIPNFIRGEYIRNMLDMSNFRFTEKVLVSSPFSFLYSFFGMN